MKNPRSTVLKSLYDTDVVLTAGVIKSRGRLVQMSSPHYASRDGSIVEEPITKSLTTQQSESCSAINTELYDHEYILAWNPRVQIICSADQCLGQRQVPRYVSDTIEFTTCAKSNSSLVYTIDFHSVLFSSSDVQMVTGCRFCSS